MTISVLTLFPEMFEGPFSHSIIKNAISKNLIKLDFINIRDFGIGKHKTVDDRPYGGGRGMMIRVDVLLNALEFAKNKFPKKSKIKQKIVLLDPTGTTYNQKVAREFSSLDHLILICGHYEGFDARIKKFIDEEISIGDFVLTGGEIPAMAIVDSVARLKQGVLPVNAADIESFSADAGNSVFLEYPQYTRPEKFKNLKVPEVLLSGNHGEIKTWRRNQSIRITKKKRPDLLKSKTVR
ncbi:MAG: tRNA (guanosine(37)-N1)-methyltransferase TrmD [Patescibacteria group bacterium]